MRRCLCRQVRHLPIYLDGWVEPIWVVNHSSNFCLSQDQSRRWVITRQQKRNQTVVVGHSRWWKAASYHEELLSWGDGRPSCLWRNKPVITGGSKSLDREHQGKCRPGVLRLPHRQQGRPHWIDRSYEEWRLRVRGLASSRCILSNQCRRWHWHRIVIQDGGWSGSRSWQTSCFAIFEGQ